MLHKFRCTTFSWNHPAHFWKVSVVILKMCFPHSVISWCWPVRHTHAHKWSILIPYVRPMTNRFCGEHSLTHILMVHHELLHCPRLFQNFMIVLYPHILSVQSSVLLWPSYHGKHLFHKIWWQVFKPDWEDLFDVLCQRLRRQKTMWCFPNHHVVLALNNYRSNSTTFVALFTF